MIEGTRQNALAKKYVLSETQDDQMLYRRLKKRYANFLRVKDHEMEYRIFTIINEVTAYLKLSKNIQNQAAYYYRKIIRNEKKVINNITVSAFCVFYAARKDLHNAPVTIREIAAAFQSFGHRVHPRLMIRDGIQYKKYLMNDSKPHKSEIYIGRLINDVFNASTLDRRMQKKKTTISKKEYLDQMMIKCREILKALNSWKRGGRNPFILAGAVIYHADKLLAKEMGKKSILTQKLISDATKIPEYSIRDHYVNLLKLLYM